MFSAVFGMLCNVLGMLCNVLGMLATSSASSACFCKVLGVPYQRNPPTCYLISCEVKGVVYHQVSYMEAWWYTTPLASQLIRQQVEGVFFDVGLLRPYKSMPRTLRTLQACLGRCKACRGRPRTLPSMPRSCQASLHILGSHTHHLCIILN